jgi:outer membrane protein OmpA-like peptidoglycan-associated protein
MSMRNQMIHLALLICATVVAGGCALIDAGTPPVAATTSSPPSSTTGLEEERPQPPPTAMAVVAPSFLCEPVDVSDANFASGSAALVGLGDDIRQVSYQLSELNRLGVPATITIVGHTDNVPSRFPDGNQGLSDARADAVRASLIDNYDIQAYWIAAVYGVADTQPKELGDDDVSLAQNRRVEVTFNCP